MCGYCYNCFLHEHIFALGAKKDHRNGRYISGVRMKIRSDFLHFIMLRHKFVFTCFRYLKNYYFLPVLIWKIINSIMALLTWLLTTTQQLDMCTWALNTSNEITMCYNNMIIRYVIGASVFCKSGKMLDYWKKLRYCEWKIIITQSCTELQKGWKKILWERGIEPYK